MELIIRSRSFLLSVLNLRMKQFLLSKQIGSKERVLSLKVVPLQNDKGSIFAKRLLQSVVLGFSNAFSLTTYVSG